jgi:hypothetical protein
MNDLPIKKSEEFLAEVEVMDLSHLKNSQFIVAVSTGDPKSFKLLASTIHGPYSFVEMLQEVGDLWATHQHHARVIILAKDVTSPVECLDENTVDYIECYYGDLIMEEMIDGAFSKEYTCQVGLLDDDGADPRRKRVEAQQSSEPESVA